MMPPCGKVDVRQGASKYPPAEPGALDCEPLKAAGGDANAAPKSCAACGAAPSYCWARGWFWRTQQQKEIDYLEERDGRLAAYEFKWNSSAKSKVPRQFQNAYSESGFFTIHPENVEDFLLPS
jgi:hypothetical protein